ncbi:HAD family hydrolase [Thiorhodovibrio frisius]|uniref:Capsule biosynthesis phosphatase n=1 Tax=Thiorhodovibrio frisius TaxID=631362 RepID=H8Z1X8_9GAMM|nr:capsule biosynthesis phosphatase [Thiorhodovibrio frisius]EIC22606.1 capsule biosynthesis phosphatase [Thiorhodovibrio frisius]WPL20047.1 capsule biosynthesis phosphatase [Thiorhodovibrio frisius]
MKRLIIDVDETLTISHPDTTYESVAPNLEVIARLRAYRAEGFEVVLSTARNMRTYDGNIGKINAHTLPILIDWLKRHDVPYDEIWTGKPWCGFEGFYVDDKAVRPDEFLRYSYEEICKLISAGNAD